MSQSLTPRVEYHLQLLNKVLQRLQQAKAQDADAVSDNSLTQLTTVIEQFNQPSQAAYDSGQDWLVQVFTFQPQLGPAIERDLLWFFGGECLHFLTDA